MKRIGIIGGVGPEASLYYYRTLIDIAREASDTERPQVEAIIYNLNHQKCGPRMFGPGRWSEFAANFIDAAQRLYRAGADFAIIACNTAHIVFDEVKANSPIPLLSIVEETCKAVEKRGLTKVGLFGSPDTMKSHYYQDVFSTKGISAIAPKGEDQAYIGNKVRGELAIGIIRDETRNGFLEIVRRMIEQDTIQGLILGCTEIPLLLGKVEFEIPFFDTSRIHVESAFNYALSGT